MPLPIDQSVKQIGPSRWSIGSLVCERINNEQYADAVAAWEEDECTYILRKAKDDEIAPPATFAESSSDDLRLVHTGGTESVVWTIGRRVFCKVHHWNPEQESEDKTIAFVKKIAPQISTPEVIHIWIDNGKSFLLVRRIEGSTLRDAWASLSLSQRQAVVETIAAYCDLLAKTTSKTLETATGRPALEPFLSFAGSNLCPLLTQKEWERHFSVILEGRPTITEEFHFYHPDLGPSNIIISDDGTVAGIIDWESAAYYPAFWIATKPTISPAFNFCPEIPEHDELEWRKRFRDELVRLGYPQVGEWYIKWMRSRPRSRT